MLKISLCSMSTLCKQTIKFHSLALFGNRIILRIVASPMAEDDPRCAQYPLSRCAENWLKKNCQVMCKGKVIKSNFHFFERADKDFVETSFESMNAVSNFAYFSGE